MKIHIETFFDPDTSTFSYIVIDQDHKKSCVIDSVMDYNIYSGCTSTKSADQIIDYINQHQLTNEWIIETHIHADHVSAAYYLQDKIGGKTAISEHIKLVLKFWTSVLDTTIDTPLTGEQFDVLLKDGDEFKIGNIPVKAIYTPGHTPACMSYLINNNLLFVGDTLFAPRIGTARCDFPGGSAENLYDSITQKMYTLPDETIVYLCHDYPSKGEEPLSQITIKEQKQNNSLLKAHTTKEDFVEARETRDFNKEVPKLIIPSIQTNMRKGDFGQKRNNGIQYITVPVDVLNQKKGSFYKVTSKYYILNNNLETLSDIIKQYDIKAILYFNDYHANNTQDQYIKNVAFNCKLDLYQLNAEESNLQQKFNDIYHKFDFHKPLLAISLNSDIAINVWKTLKNK